MQVVSLARKVLNIGGPSSFVLLTVGRRGGQSRLKLERHTDPLHQVASCSLEHNW